MFAELREALVPLVAATGDPDQPRNDGVFGGPFSVDDPARRGARAARRASATTPTTGAWTRRCTRSRRASRRPTCASRRSTTSTTTPSRCTPCCTSSATGSTRPPSTRALVRTTLAEPVSLGVHESQSRLWENIVGRSRPFCAWLLPRLRRQFPGAFDDIDAGRPLPRGQHGPAVADPHRGRRDDLQPPHHPALRARARADGGHARGRRPAGRVERRGRSGCSASRSRATPRACSRTPTGAPG